MTEHLVVGPDTSGLTVVITGGRVERCERGQAQAEGARLLPCPAGRILPGRVNAHTHIYSGLAPLGMPPPAPPPETFVQILERVWWRLDRALDAASLRASARLYIAEALLAGTTALVDHHESPTFIEGSLDVLADACDELGLRALLCYGATERNGGRSEARRGLAECERFARRAGGLTGGLVALHASFTVSDDTVRDAGRLCRELGTVMHVHMAEDQADVIDAQERGFAGPLERLLDLDALPEGSILAHGVHLSAEQVTRAADAGLWLVQNPRSNRGNRVGYPAALTHSSRVALGTDGYPARMDEEAQELLAEARAHGEDLEAARARRDGGHSLLAERLGVPFVPLAPGAAADLRVEVEGEVRHVVVDGRVVVQDGRLATADLAQIREEAAAQAGRLWQRMEELS